MKPNQTDHLVPAIAVLAFSISSVFADPVGSALAYRGRLNDGGQPASGNYDVKFALYAASVPTSGAQVGAAITNINIVVSNGLFNATIDFGADAFNGDARWLQIGVRTNGSTADFQYLAPLQALRPQPYALYSLKGGAGGGITNNQSGVTLSGPYLSNIHASGAYGNVLINSNLHLEFSTTGGELRVGSMAEFASAGYGEGYPGGSYGTLISPMFVGSAAGLYDNVQQGPQTWTQQPLPVMMWSFYTAHNVVHYKPWMSSATNVQACVDLIASNHLLLTTNYGIRNVLVNNACWIHGYRNNDGTLRYNTTNFPTHITNTVAYVRGKGMEFWVDWMYTARTPAAGYTESILEKGMGIFWADGVGSSFPPPPNTGGVWIPAMTANSVHSDIYQLYKWGVEGIVLLNQAAAPVGGSGNAGYRDQRNRQIAYSTLYPKADPAHGQGDSYLWWCQPRMQPYEEFIARHGMSVTLWQPHQLHDLSAAYYCNNFGFDTGSNDEDVPGHGLYGTALAYSQISYPLSWITNLPPASTHFVMQTMEWEGRPDFSNWTSNDWQSVFGMQAVWHSTLQFSYPFAAYVTNGWFQNLYTNSSFLSILADKAQNWPQCTTFNKSNSIFCNRLSSQQNALAVLMSNTATNAGTSTNLTLLWAQAGLNTNLTCMAQDVWSGTNYGNYTGSITMNVPAHSSVFFTLTPVLASVGALTGLSPASLSPGTAAIDISGNAATATTAATANTAGTANNFSGLLAGDVTGPQGATVVASLGGQSAAKVASGADAANAATATNTPDTIVKRDVSGNFAAGSINAASVSGDGSGLTALNASQLASGTLAEERLSANVALLNAHQTFSGSNRFTGVVQLTNTANSFAGIFSGNGAGLSNLTVNASNVVGMQAQLIGNGLIRLGSESGTLEAPSPAGLVVRRVNSTDRSANKVVARSDVLTLERDGTSGGFLIRYPAHPGHQAIACMGINAAGAAVNFYTKLNNPASAGTVALYRDSQKVVHFRCSFGNTWSAGHLTEVTLSRYATDAYWRGTVTSTLSQ